MTAHFQPKRADGRPVWRVIYDEVGSLMKGGAINIGDLIEDACLLSLLDGKERPRYYAAVIRASKELEREAHRTLVRDRGLGYRLSAGMGQVERSDNERKRGLRRYKRGFELITTTDYGLLTADDRSRVDLKTRALGMLLIWAKETDEKLAAHDQRMKDLGQQVITSASRQTATDEEVAELKRRLEAIEGKKKDD